MRFQSVVILGGKTATGIEVPDEVVASLGSTKRPAVTVTIADYTYRTTIAPMSGRFFIPLSAENRTKAGVAAGDSVEVEVELDTEPRVVVVPADFGTALDADPAARKFFNGLSYTHQREHVRAIESAKAEATRVRRIDAAVAKLRDGRK